MKIKEFAILTCMFSSIMLSSCSKEDTLAEHQEELTSEEMAVLNQIQQDHTIHFFGTHEFISKVDSLISLPNRISYEADSLIALEMIEYGKIYLEKNGMRLDSDLSFIENEDIGIMAICLASIEMQAVLQNNTTRGTIEEGLMKCLVHIFFPLYSCNIIDDFMKEYKKGMKRDEIKQLIFRLLKKYCIPSFKLLKEMIGSDLVKEIPGIGYIVYAVDVADCLIDYYNLVNDTNSTNPQEENNELFEMADSCAINSVDSIYILPC